MMQPCKTLLIYTRTFIRKMYTVINKKRKGRFAGHQVSSNYRSKPIHVKNRPIVVGRLSFFI